MKALVDIKNLLSENKHRLLEKYPIKSLGIFGSYSRNEQKENSDVDILVEFSGKIGIRFIDLAEEIEGILKVKVDLVSRNAIKDKYFKSISSKIIYV